MEALSWFEAAFRSLFLADGIMNAEKCCQILTEQKSQHPKKSYESPSWSREVFLKSTSRKYKKGKVKAVMKNKLVGRTKYWLLKVCQDLVFALHIFLCIFVHVLKYITAFLIFIAKCQTFLSKLLKCNYKSNLATMRWN